MALKRKVHIVTHKAVDSDLGKCTRLLIQRSSIGVRVSIKWYIFGFKLLSYYGRKQELEAKHVPTLIQHLNEESHVTS